MTEDADRDYLLRIAIELEREAADLEQQATVATQVQPPRYSSTQAVRHVQQQQQQEELKGPEDGKKPKD